ncbi:hypothetical protein BO86DRAFT_377174 [Aspergillus japonicus CBS 114.51]|uniref:Uncharacterized protein n=2 Tax=Aspergillus TaxID=5052 RepID=A0A2V5HCL6_ASPV1|nr:hypothetical protein BO86DRAFT_377174 [Aspergillus japonicus CBS 114.51]PYI21421.1 hypothetical protein BO99DRAFT_410931 [Aspergillus violaceofuscus CBS 115571]RAH84426.1 hypothetical protein BO86DRAFT_377174 [Aspergillus japonicus CBS 114.51]
MPSLRSNASLLGLLLLLNAFWSISLVEASPVALQRDANQYLSLTAAFQTDHAVDIASVNAQFTPNEHPVGRVNPAGDALNTIHAMTKAKRDGTDSSGTDDDNVIKPSVSYSLLGKVSTIIDHLRH